MSPCNTDIDISINSGLHDTATDDSSIKSDRAIGEGINGGARETATDGGAITAGATTATATATATATVVGVCGECARFGAAADWDARRALVMHARLRRNERYGRVAADGGVDVWRAAW